MALARLDSLSTIFTVADAVRNARAVADDYLVGVTDPNEAVAASIRQVHELRFDRHFRERRLNPEESARLRRRETACRAVTFREDRRALAGEELRGMIRETERQLLRPPTRADWNRMP